MVKRGKNSLQGKKCTKFHLGHISEWGGGVKEFSLSFQVHKNKRRSKGPKNKNQTEYFHRPKGDLQVVK